MRQVVRISEDLTPEEAERLIAVLMYHLAEKCGGQLVFTRDDASQTVLSLNTKMVHIHIGNDIMLRIVTRPPELQEVPDEQEQSS